MQLIEHADSPRSIRLHALDNVVIVVNDQGVPAGTEFPDGLVTVDFIPQSHKVTLEDIPEGGRIIRYGQTIGYALRPIPRGSWVQEDQLRMPTAPPLD
ncbi:MAG: UxaA family hydrolase, partial [Pseudomonas sp.]